MLRWSQKEGISVEREEQLSDEEHESDDLTSYHLARARERRVVRAPNRYGFADSITDTDDIAFAFVSGEEFFSDEPKSYHEAITGVEKDLWLQAMKEGMQSLHKNQTWILVDRPAKGKIVTCKWIFKKKLEGEKLKV